MVVKNICVVCLLFVSGCSLMYDLDKFKLSGVDSGFDIGDANETTNDSDIDYINTLDSSTMDSSTTWETNDSGNQVLPIVDAGSDSAFIDIDSQVNEEVDATVIDLDSGLNTLDSATSYPHGCVPPSQWCQKRDKCMYQHELSINNATTYCGNCTLSQAGVWTCLD